MSFGYEEIFEKDFALNVSFVKRHDVGIHGGDWTASVSVTPKVKDRPIYLSLFFYVGMFHSFYFCFKKIINHLATNVKTKVKTSLLDLNLI